MVVKYYQVIGEGYEVKGKVVDGFCQVNEEIDVDLYEFLCGGLLVDNVWFVLFDDYYFCYIVLGDLIEVCLEVVVKKVGLNVYDEC